MKATKSTLVIIDMQPSYEAARLLSCVNNVIKEIKIARENDEPIIVVEYHDGCQDATDKRIMDELIGYSKCYLVNKSACDGGKKIKTTIRKNKLPRDNLRVCGVQIGFCVKDTVETLLSVMPKTKITVVRRACNDQSSYGPKKDRWKLFRKSENLVFV